MQKRNLLLVTAFVFILYPGYLKAQKKKTKPEINSQKAELISPEKQKNESFKAALNTIGFRKIGPAKTSGRIVDIVVNTHNPSEYYVAAAYGGVWKTENAGVTFQPIFDNYNTQSIGCLALDPNNSNVLWVGTGENNNQRSVGYGNGIYKSIDGGKTFELLGLQKSMHIGMISINPKNSDDVLVAAYGPVWNSGGDRGIYQSLDGGKNWKRILHISDETGFNEIYRDPFNDQVLYATSHQRRRHEWTYLGGGPESGLHISSDAGKTWKKSAGGFPQGELGRISIATGKNTAGLIYAIVEGKKDQGGVYVSRDFGASWKKTNGFQTSGNYYQEMMIDPKNDSRLFFMDTYLHYSEDGGVTIKPFPEDQKHVDNHAIWIDPKNPNHLLVGCDGGLYETFENGKSWHFKENISITQFYRVSVDNSKPFYNVYGGTQDNFSMGGPSRNNTSNGIGNDEWFVTVGGDGFKSQIDPVNPDIVYAQWQYGGLVRFNKKWGDNVDIRPTVKSDEDALRWNWDAPLLISKYNHKKLYFAANKVFSSLDQGDSWKSISPDLSRNMDRNTIPVMGKQWGIEAVAKNQSTSIYGNITYLAEGRENQLVAGTDDGKLHITNNDGLSWSEISIPWKSLDIPVFTFDYLESKNSAMKSIEIYPLISSILFSSHNNDIIYISFDNHRQGDFAPHLYKVTLSTNTWLKLGADLPSNGSIKCLFEDPKDGKIILTGTEFGLYISINSGENFVSWMNGLPPIAIKDIAYQSDADDIVLATFGRGFVVCDDYELIRTFIQNENKKLVVKPEHQLFIPYSKLGHGGNAYQGDGRFMGENLSEKLKIRIRTGKKFNSLADERKSRENKAVDKEVIYPTKSQIIAEELEINSQYFLHIYKNSKFIATLNVANTENWQTVEWNCRYSVTTSDLNVKNNIQLGPFVNPGIYSIHLYSLDYANNKLELIDSTKLNIDYLFESTQTRDSDKLIAAKKIDNREEKINQVIDGMKTLNSVETKLNKLETIWKNGINESLQRSPEKMKYYNDWKNLSIKFHEIKTSMYGNTILASHEFESKRGVAGEISNTFYEFGGSLQAPTQTHMDHFNHSLEVLKSIKKQLDSIESELVSLQNQIM